MNNIDNCLFSGRIALIFLSLLIVSGALFSCSGNKGKGGVQIPGPHISLILNPSQNNPRNSEGDFITLKDGQILFIYSKYSGDSSHDNAPASLVGRYSSDSGKTWTLKDEMIVSNEGGMNIMSVSLLRLKNDEIAMFYSMKNSHEDNTPVMRISKDEAKTWSSPIKIITDKQGYFVLNNDRVIQLENGRILLPVAMHNSPGGKWSGKGNLFSYYSDDNGSTWQSGIKVPDSTDIVTQEPGLIELRDGRVMMYLRASGGFQRHSFSEDNGVTWSQIQKSNIPSPVSPASIEKIPSNGDWLLIWNNNDGSKEALKGKRTPLTTAVSKDEGKTWEMSKNIESETDGWYCYTAIEFVDDYVLLGYCAGKRKEGVSGSGLATTQITRLNINWIYK